MFTNLKTSLFAILVGILTSCSVTQNSENQSVKQAVDFVNPYMGNISHLLVPTFPTVHLPNSMLRVHPARREYSDVLLNGLPVLLTAHRGKTAFNLSPFQGNERDLKPAIKYSYDLEKLTPYSYYVYLDEQGIDVDFEV